MRKELWLLICSTVVWLFGAFFLLAREAGDPLLEQDEVYWIGSAYYFDLAWVKREWRHEAWRWLPARENPPVSKYVIGLGLAAAGERITTVDNLSYYYLRWLRWETKPEAQPANETEEKRAQVIRASSPGFREAVLKTRRAPLPRHVVNAARNTILVCAALSSLQLFLFGLSCGSRVTGIAASLLILIHPVSVSAAQHAMADTVALLFSSAAAWSVALWYQRFSRDAASLGDGTANSLTVGVMLALACGAKMNSLIVVLLAGVGVALVMFQRWRMGATRSVVKVAVHGLIILGSGVAVFAVINPAVLNDFIGGMGALFAEHGHSLSIQTDLRYPRPIGVLEKMGAVIAMAFYGWQFFVFMLVVLIWAAAWHRENPVLRIVVCWWIVAFVCVAVWLPFSWPRYTLPVIPPSLLLIGFAAHSGWEWLANRCREYSSEMWAGRKRAFTTAK